MDQDNPDLETLKADIERMIKDFNQDTSKYIQDNLKQILYKVKQLTSIKRYFIMDNQLQIRFSELILQVIKQKPISQDDFVWYLGLIQQRLPECSELQKLHLKIIASCQIQALSPLVEIIQLTIEDQPPLAMAHQIKILGVMKIKNIEKIKKLLSINIQNAYVCESIALYFNFISYKNKQVKDQLIQDGILNLLVGICIEHLKQDQLVYEALRTILSLLECNITHIVLLDLEIVRVFLDWNKLKIDNQNTFYIILLILSFYQDIYLIDRMINQNVLQVLLVHNHVKRKDIVLTNLKLINLFIHNDKCAIKSLEYLYYFEKVLSFWFFDESIMTMLIQTVNHIAEMSSVDVILQYQILQQIPKVLFEIQNNKQLLIELLLLLITVSTDTVRCHIIWSMDIIEMLMKILIPRYLSDMDIVHPFTHLLNLYSQIQEPLAVINRYITNVEYEYQHKLSIVEPPQFILQQEDKEYLTKGVLCKIFKENGSYREMILLVSLDLASIQCKHQKRKHTKAKWRLATKNITNIKDYAIDQDWKHSPFKKYNSLIKKPEQELCFTISGLAHINNQLTPTQFHICAPSLLDKNKLFSYMKLLIQK